MSVAGCRDDQIGILTRSNNTAPARATPPRPARSPEKEPRQAPSSEGFSERRRRF
jgi:hypothetical protein